MSAVNDPTPAGPPPGGDGIQATPPAGAVTGTQTAPAPEAPPVPLPPRPRPEPITAEEMGRAMARFDRMIVLLVLVLAALVAVFPVRNSDFWLHLAAARDWLAGKFHLGDDPYSYTNVGGWVNHSWLYGLLVYGLYQLLGGPAVVIFKAILSVALAAVLLSVRRRGQSIWIPAACTALAVVAISPRLLMQPAVISFLLLAITVAVLMWYDRRERPQEDRKRRHGAGAAVPWLGEPADRPLWLLVPLFALWVNLDSWFVLGPLAVALYLGGRLLEAMFASGQPGTARPGAWRPLAVVLAAGVAACLLSPFGLHGLTLPGEIGAGDVVAALRQDDEFSRMFTSPWQQEYFTRPELGRNIAGMAYFPLVLVGLASFALSLSPFRWGRAVLWVGFLVLSISHVRAVPFFAVVAGPVAALNFQEYAARRFGTEPVATGWRANWALLGRGLTVLAVFVLALLAWPGWLFGFPHEMRREARRVGLTVEPLPEMTRLAEQIQEWRRDGTLTEEDRILNLQPEIANGLAWLCPDQKWFFDYRLDNYSGGVANDYVTVRKMFDPLSGEAGKANLAEQFGQCEKILDKYRDGQQRISALLLYHTNPAIFQRRRMRAAQAQQYLVALHLDGHSAVYGRRAERLRPQTNSYLDWMRSIGYAAALPPLPPPVTDTGRFKGKEFDPWLLAFGPKAEPLPPGAPRRPQPLAWWYRFAFGPGAHAVESDDAAAYLDYVQDTSYRFHYEKVILPVVRVSFPALLGMSAVRTGSALGDAFALGVHSTLTLTQLPPVERDEFGPIYFGRASPVVLAIRSARRALLRNPDDADAYLHLGRAYAMLPRQTEERRFSKDLVLLGQMRNVQAISALRSAVLLDPDLAPAHYWLAILYGRSGFIDLQLKHKMELVRCLRRASRQGGTTDEQFEEQMKSMEDDNKKLEKAVKDNQLDYEVKSDKKRVIEKVQIALSKGLGDKALQVLLDSDSLEFGPDGARMELELLLSMGRLDELRVQLWPADPTEREHMPDDLNSKMGIGTYERYAFLLAAAEGNYEEADQMLERGRDKTLKDAGQLQRFRQQLGLEGMAAAPIPDAEGPGKNLSIPQLMALGVGKAILEGAPAPGILPYQVGRRILRDVPLAELMQMAPPLLMAANYETMRGVLKMESGDIAGARQRFRQALFADKDQQGGVGDIVLGFPGAHAAYRYLRLTEEKD